MITKRTLLIASTALAGVAALGTASLAADFTGTVTIVHINDVHAHIDGTDTQIGYPKIAGFVEQTRAENPNTLFLDAGDAIAGDPYASIDRGLGFLPILNTLGIDAMTAGNSEFAYGSDHLKTFAAGLSYPLLVDNMVYTATGEPFSEGFTLVELPNGMTAGIVGVTTHQSGVMASTDLEYVDAVAATERLVGEATEAGADFIVGLLHLGELEEDVQRDPGDDQGRGKPAMPPQPLPGAVVGTAGEFDPTFVTQRRHTHEAAAQSVTICRKLTSSKIA